jgi:hypothetical protein
MTFAEFVMFRGWMRGSAMALTTGGDGGDGDQRPDLDVPPHSLPSVKVKFTGLTQNSEVDPAI